MFLILLFRHSAFIMTQLFAPRGLFVIVISVRVYVVFERLHLRLARDNPRLHGERQENGGT